MSTSRFLLATMASMCSMLHACCARRSAGSLAPLKETLLWRMYSLILSLASVSWLGLGVGVGLGLGSGSGSGLGLGLATLNPNPKP